MRTPNPGPNRSDIKPFEPADYLDKTESQIELLRNAFASGRRSRRLFLQREPMICK